MSDYTTIELDVSPAGVAVVLLNRPEKHNAFNAHVVDELRDVFSALSKSSNVRMVILRGAGDNFSAGADLEWMRAAADYTEHENFEDALALAEMLRELHDMPHPTMALIQGKVFGGGIGLISACDMAIGMKDSQFCFSEVKLGLTPATISPYVVNAIGPRWAKALFTTAETFDAAFAYQIGLLQYTAETEMEMDTLEEDLTAKVFNSGPTAVGDAKKLVNDVFGLEIDHALSRMTAKRIAHRRMTDEAKEGVSAFLERRKPDWV